MSAAEYVYYYYYLFLFFFSFSFQDLDSHVPGSVCLIGTRHFVLNIRLVYSEVHEGEGLF